MCSRRNTSPQSERCGMFEKARHRPPYESWIALAFGGMCDTETRVSRNGNWTRFGHILWDDIENSLVRGTRTRSGSRCRTSSGKQATTHIHQPHGLESILWPITNNTFHCNFKHSSVHPYKLTSKQSLQSQDAVGFFQPSRDLAVAGSRIANGAGVWSIPCSRVPSNPNNDSSLRSFVSTGFVKMDRKQ